jgi:hypothetical protein
MMVSYTISILIVIIFGIAALMLQKYFPPVDWRDYFSKAPAEKEILSIYEWNIYLIYILLFLLECIALRTIKAETFLQS